MAVRTTSARIHALKERRPASCLGNWSNILRKESLTASCAITWLGRYRMLIPIAKPKKCLKTHCCALGSRLAQRSIQCFSFVVQSDSHSTLRYKVASPGRPGTNRDDVIERDAVLLWIGT